MPCAAAGAHWRRRQQHLAWASVKGESGHQPFAGAEPPLQPDSLCALFSFPMQEGSLWPSESTMSGNGIAEVRATRVRVPLPLLRPWAAASHASLFSSLSAANLHPETR